MWLLDSHLGYIGRVFLMPIGGARAAESKLDTKSCLRSAAKRWAQANWEGQILIEIIKAPIENFH
jgi:hypothetical protein